MTAGRLVIASDHAGFPLKEVLRDELQTMGLKVDDLGTHTEDSVDYPDFAEALATAIKNGKADRGVLVCGTGIGIGMAANRHPWIRAAVCHDVTSTRLARAHNDANVVVMGARLIGSETAKDCLRVFLETAFDGDRHVRRVDKLAKLPA
ncbi:MAG: ribose 5-phosphate isomerase B [Pseudomonadota bacterium]